jgi:hypothetical protein
MFTDEGQTQAAANQQEKRSTMTTASAVVGGGHQGRERTNRQHNTSITTGGNNYKKELIQSEQRKPSYKNYDPQSKATMTMMSNNKTTATTATAALSESHHKPTAVGLVPKSSFDSKGTTLATTATTTTTATTSAEAKDIPQDTTKHTPTTTTSTLTSKTAVSLVPQSHGSKGTQQNHKAGNTKQKDPVAATTPTVPRATPNTATTDPNDTYDGLMTVVIAPPMDMWRLLKKKRWYSQDFSCRRAKKTFRQYDWYYLYRIKATTVLATIAEANQINEKYVYPT